MAFAEGACTCGRRWFPEWQKRCLDQPIDRTMQRVHRRLLRRLQSHQSNHQPRVSNRTRTRETRFPGRLSTSAHWTLDCLHDCLGKFRDRISVLPSLSPLAVWRLCGPVRNGESGPGRAAPSDGRVIERVSANPLIARQRARYSPPRRASSPSPSRAAANPSALRPRWATVKLGLDRCSQKVPNAGGQSFSRGRLQPSGSSPLGGGRVRELDIKQPRRRSFSEIPPPFLDAGTGGLDGAGSSVRSTVKEIAVDPYRLDRDGDGRGCTS